MKANVVSRFRPIANANYRLLQELTQWVERKNTNPFPVDPLVNHPTLSPYHECTANHERNHEDHLARPNIPPLPYKVQSGPTQRTIPWKTPATAYSCFFDDSDEKFTRNYLSGPFPPFEQFQPFGKFPHAHGETRTPPVPNTRDPVFVKQAAEDTRTGRQYKQIFESATCL
jgi:hypothetical protein